YAGPDNLVFCASNHCHYFDQGLQCKFCDMNHNTSFQKSMKREFYVRLSPEDFYDVSFEAMKEKGRWRQNFVTGGTDPRENLDRDVDFYSRIIKAIKDGAKDSADSDFPTNLLMHPLEKEQYQRLKEAGLNGFGSYIEVFDKEKWELICPGKAKTIGYDNWLKRTLQAVEIFGRGNVSTGWVPGVEMAPPPYGFEDIDKALNSTLGGYKFFIQNGITIAGSNWALVPGSEFFKMGATQPPLEFYIKLDLGRFRLYKEYGGFKEGVGAISCDSMGRRSQPWSCYPDYQKLL
ncbi:MAG: radical SAM protein, partial [Thermodesulfobacteriota bacterium]|nr:radical SAM protein [Thermodesulfobacteriota bacterium]